MFRQPEGKHGDFMGKVIYFNAVKLADGNGGHGQQSGHAFQHLHFQPAHFFERHNQEVAGTAGGVKKTDVAEPLNKLPGPGFMAPGLPGGVFQLFQEQRAQHLHDVGNGSVMLPQAGAFVRRHAGLEHVAENIRIDV